MLHDAIVRSSLYQFAPANRCWLMQMAGLRTSHHSCGMNGFIHMTKVSLKELAKREAVHKTVFEDVGRFLLIP